MQTESISLKVQRYSDTVIKQFHPLVIPLGFIESEWDYDPDLGIIRVQFENPQKKNAVQVDYHIQGNSYGANYCRMESGWKVCTEGKPQTLAGLRATLSRWILRQCPDCGTKPVEQEEYDE